MENTIRYDYHKNMEEELRNWIKENNYIIDKTKNDWFDALWCECMENMTGINQGSWTCNRWIAKEFIENNEELIIYAINNDYMTYGWYGQQMLKKNYEAIDSIIRYSILSEVIENYTENLN